MSAAMLAAALWLLFTLVLCLALLAATPVVLRVSAVTEPQLRLRLGAAPLAGLIPAIAVYDSGRPAARKRRPRGKRRQGPGRTARSRAGDGARIGPALFRLGPDLLARLHFSHLHVEATYGLEDPAGTGALFGAIAAAGPVLSALPRVSLDLHPDFAGARVAGRVEAEARLTPVALLPPLARFAWRAWGPGR